MSETLETARLAVVAHGGRCSGSSVLASSPAGCTSMSQDVDAYYRQMAYNYKEAAEKAKMDAVTLENETKVLATTGDFSNLKKDPAPARAASRPGKRSARRSQSDSRRPPSGRKPTFTWKNRRFPTVRPGLKPLDDTSVLQASGAKSP